MTKHPVQQWTMAGLVDRAAREWPDQLAVHDGERRRTFADLRVHSHSAAKAIIARGLEHGERIAIWAPNALDWIIVALAAEQVGLVVVPLNTRYRGREAADILRRSQARMLFATREFLGTDLPALLEGEDLPDLQGCVAIDPDADELVRFVESGKMIDDAQLAARIAAVTPEAIADILFTSGTTGKPKGVLCSQSQNIRSFQAWSDAVGLRQGDRYAIVNPFFHSFGYKAGWLACLLAGATAYPVAMFDAVSLLSLIERERITVLPGAPTLYQSMLDEPSLAQHDISSLRLAVTGAASVPPSLIRRLREDLGIDDVLTAYGLTEATGVVTTTRPDDPAELIAVSCGIALPGVELRIVDGEGNQVPTGEPGELLVRGFNVMIGYHNDPAATEEAIDADGWLRTGDIAVQDENGYVRITDRAKDLFICGGFNCYPAEIEAILIDHPEIARAAVIGIPDQRMGEVGQAWLVLRSGTTFDEPAMIAWCRSNMANFKVPRSFRIVDELPTSASGKVQRFALRETVPG
ncbi:FadD3 family acyl-CoA ligase [Croceicoccus sp. F390]|uniref:FadD3 family acyl-CoA ligase n=1 Tax=Croceicoccus esteveae TaxID=3075597 RepID=A0ABU2ZG32_9SPHN|nr:FadD3 family acyl-CoA ligase [Croceicoccus sp. F390]MDT0575181.1 FadD3 family acyl-CoA ligase [Croceicoccus sp. F390]